MRGALLLVLLWGLLQLVPVQLENPTGSGEIAPPPEVRQILKRSCYDCHSNETRWPWYAAVAPASWLMSWDVGEARSHLNFSSWRDYDDSEREDLYGDIWDEVDEGAMPRWYYLPLHREAELSDADRKAIYRWTQDEIAALQ
jgi:hypothetical protein